MMLVMRVPGSNVINLKYCAMQLTRSGKHYFSSISYSIADEEALQEGNTTEDNLQTSLLVQDHVKQEYSSVTCPPERPEDNLLTSPLVQDHIKQEEKSSVVTCSPVRPEDNLKTGPLVEDHIEEEDSSVFTCPPVRPEEQMILDEDSDGAVMSQDMEQVAEPEEEL